MQWIDQPDELASLFDLFCDSPAIAVDTESNQFTAYNPRICLIQIASEERVVLLDPLPFTTEELAPLGRLLAEPSIRKVVHSAQNDILGLARDFSFRLQNLFDTSLASFFLKLPHHGLDHLLQEIFQVHVSKRFQRLDWKKRPLPEDALVYAATDVRYLLPLYRRFTESLAEAGWLDATLQESESLTSSEVQPKSFDPEGYRRIQGAERLSPPQKKLLQLLAIWRHFRCQEEDRAAFLFLPDQALLAIVERSPKTPQDLAAIKGISKHTLHSYSREILSFLADPSKLSTFSLEDLPPSPPKKARYQDDKDTQEIFERLRLWRHDLVKQIGIDPGVLWPNQLLWKIAQGRPTTPEDLLRLPGFQPWRLPLFASSLLELLHSTEVSDPTRG